MTSKDAEKRKSEHNRNKSKFTRGHQPWILIYREQLIDKKKATLREKYLKSGKGREWLNNKFK